MEANMEIFYILEGKKNNDGIVEPFTLQTDALYEILQRYHPSLIVFDPIQGFLGDIDLYKANEVRGRLAKLIKMAEDFCCAILFVRHLAKAPASRAIYKGLGSIDFSAVARSILLVGEKDNQKALIHLKSSLEKKGPSIGFEIKEGQFLWSGEVEITAFDVLTPEENPKTSALQEAKQFLMETLKDGPVLKQEISKQAKKLGISEITLRRAKDELKIVSSPQRDKDGKLKGWTWELPCLLYTSPSPRD